MTNPLFELEPHEEDYDCRKEKIRVYTYTRVSTAMQVDGYSLDAQKAKMKAYADYNDYEIVGEYEDAGKSGKSIEGRAQFSQMMEDIKSGKDGVVLCSGVQIVPVRQKCGGRAFLPFRSCRILASIWYV